jgi:hypothetical protein
MFQGKGHRYKKLCYIIKENTYGIEMVQSKNKTTEHIRNEHLAHREVVKCISKLKKNC